MVKKGKGRRFRPESVGDYPVGYGKPPMTTRFKPGESGNKSGTSKENLDLRDIALRELQRKITVHEGDRATKVTKFGAMIMACIAEAVKGRPSAVGALGKLIEMAGSLLPRSDKNIEGNDASGEGPSEIVVRFVRPTTPPSAGDYLHSDEFGNVFENAEGEYEATVLTNPPLRTKRGQ